jgi:hypothetical protein
MTLQDASNLINISRAEQDVLKDPTLNMWDKARALTSIQNAAAAAPETAPWITPGDITRGAVGAGLGYGAATIMGKLLGVSQGTLGTFQNMGMGLGTLFNTGILKMNSAQQTEQERREAWRLGFIKAAVDLGLLDRFAKHGGFGDVVIPVTPEYLTAPIKGLSELGHQAATNAGAIGGQMLNEGPADVDVARMRLERRQLEDSEQQLIRQRRQAMIRKVLNNRNRVAR